MPPDKFFEYYTSVRRTMPYRPRNILRDAYFGNEMRRWFKGETTLVFVNSIRSEIAVFPFQQNRYLIWDQGQLDLFERLNYFVTCLSSNEAGPCVRILVYKYMLAQFDARSQSYLAGWHLDQLTRLGVPPAFDDIRLDQGQQVFIGLVNQLQELFCFGHELAHLLSADASPTTAPFDAMVKDIFEMISEDELEATEGLPWSPAVASGLFLGDPDAYKNPERNRELGILCVSTLKSASSLGLASELKADLFAVDYVLNHKAVPLIDRSVISHALNLCLLSVTSLHLLRSIAVGVVHGTRESFLDIQKEALARFILVNQFIDARLGYLERTDPNPAVVQLCQKFASVVLAEVSHYESGSIVAPQRLQSALSRSETLSSEDRERIETALEEYMAAHDFGVDVAL